MLVEIGFELFNLGNAPVASLAPIALFHQVLEVDRWSFIADRDVDFTLGEDVVRDLVVSPAGQALRLQIILWVHMMYV